MAIDYPNLQRSATAPRLPPETDGIAIHAPTALRRDQCLVVSGSFQFAHAVADAIDHQLHRAVVLVVSIGRASRARTVFAGKALFADDEERNPWGRRGFFQCDAFAEAGFDYPGKYYLLCSLGAFTSNIVEVAVE